MLYLPKVMVSLTSNAVVFACHGCSEDGADVHDGASNQNCVTGTDPGHTTLQAMEKRISVPTNFSLGARSQWFTVLTTPYSEPML
jgi:hypothetical protein